MTDILTKEMRGFFKFKKTERVWHVPLLAALCVGIPLLAGLYFDNLPAGALASIAGIVILYLPIPGTGVANRMITLMACSFGFMVSFTVGYLSAFHWLASAAVTALYSVAVHWVTVSFKIRPPGNFFFIMIAVLAGSMRFDLSTLPHKTGLIGLSVMSASFLAFIYVLAVSKKEGNTKSSPIAIIFARNSYADIWEAVLLGMFLFVSMVFGHYLKLKNPYWAAISCLAVMQGATLYGIQERVFHRIAGTFIGLGVTWLALSYFRTPVNICLCIITMQFIIEILVVRHYAFAVIFITPMTLLLTEIANPMLTDPSSFIMVRFWIRFLVAASGPLAAGCCITKKSAFMLCGDFEKRGWQ